MMTPAQRNLRDLKAWIDFGGAPYKLGVDDLADRSGYARHHLQRIFKAEFGITMGVYLRRRRLAFARHLFCQRGWDFGAAAEYVGYDCYQSFCRAYRREFDSIPSVDRDIWQRENQ